MNVHLVIDPQALEKSSYEVLFKDSTSPASAPTLPSTDKIETEAVAKVMIIVLNKKKSNTKFRNIFFAIC